jgi:hypothetical protein
MPLRSLLRASTVLLAGIAAGCSGARTFDGEPITGPWADGLPRGRPTVVTLENLNYDPPRVLGLVSENHPAAKREEASLRQSGIKRLSDDLVDVLLEKLEDEGFLSVSAPLAEFKPVDSKVVLRRLTVTIGDERRAFTLMRRPSKELADRFTAQARAVQEMFNGIVDFRLDTANHDPFLFYEVEQRLLDSNAQKTKGLPAAPKKDGGP